MKDSIKMRNGIKEALPYGEACANSPLCMADCNKCPFDTADDFMRTLEVMIKSTGVREMHLLIDKIELMKRTEEKELQYV